MARHFWPAVERERIEIIVTSRSLERLLSSAICTHQIVRHVQNYGSLVFISILGRFSIITHTRGTRFVMLFMDTIITLMFIHKNYLSLHQFVLTFPDTTSFDFFSCCSAAAYLHFTCLVPII
jgi:hypothetical protein